MKDFREIPLTQGKVALVDAEDYDWLMGWKWRVLHSAANLWYARRTVRKISGDAHRKDEFMHRVIMEAPKGIDTDHINGDGLDNRRYNLRICTHQQNIRNQRPQINRTSQYKGVSKHSRTGRWQCGIQHNSKVIWLGYFDNEEEAGLAYNTAATELFGEFARLNIIQD